MTRPLLRIVRDESPWNDRRSFRPDLLEALARSERRLRQRPTFGARLVDFFRFHGDRIGIACFVLATLAGMYFAFQLGRGLPLWAGWLS